MATRHRFSAQLCLDQHVVLSLLLRTLKQFAENKSLSEYHSSNQSRCTISVRVVFSVVVLILAPKKPRDSPPQKPVFLACPDSLGC